MDEISLKLVLNFRTAVAFTPVRGVGYGPWECWRNCKGGELSDGTAGLIPTGDWLCWNADQMQHMGFADPKQAEMFCVYLNGPGERTRVVDPFAGERVSEIVFDDIASKIGAEIARLSDSAPSP